MLKRLKFLTLGLALVLPLAACDDDEPPPIVDPVQEIGNISGAALIEGAALPGATIAIAGPQASTAVTDAGGAYSFTGVPVGAYTVTISGGPSDITFATSTVSVTVTNGGTATADFAGTYIRTAALAIGVTVDTGDGPEGVPGVPIAVTGTESRNNPTGADGSFTFTGLRKGSYTIEIDVSGLPEQVVISTSQTATLDVGQTIALVFAGAIAQEPTISISSMMQVTGAGAGLPVNPAAVLKTIAIIINHDVGDDQAERLSLLLNDVEVDFQTFSSTGVAALEGPARTPGDPVTFTVNTAGFDTGTFAVDFPNGDYEVKAQLTLASGKVVTATAGTPLTFANLDVLTVRHTSGGKGFVSAGVRWWGAETINFDAIAIIYSQAVSIGSIGVTATAPFGSTANSTIAALDLGSGHAVQNRATTAPFTYTATVARNGAQVEDQFNGVGFPAGQTLTITSVRDPGGVEILPDFARGTNTPLVGFMTDFVAPVVNSGGTSVIGAATVDIPTLNVAPAHGLADWLNAGTLAINNVSELGVGGTNQTFDVDDLGVAGSPDFTGIKGVSNLPETRNTAAAGYTAILTNVSDDLGNLRDISAATGTPVELAAGGTGIANTSDFFGVDFGAPVLTAVLPDPAVALIFNPNDMDANAADNTFVWTSSDPLLADGATGSSLWAAGINAAAAATFTFTGGPVASPTFGVDHTAAQSVAVAGVISASPPGIGYTITFGGYVDPGTGIGPFDGVYTYTSINPDLAEATANATTLVWSITMDGTSPTTNMLNPPPGTVVSSNNTLTFDIQGNAFDANGLSSVLVTVRAVNGASGADPEVCELADDLIPNGTTAGTVVANTIDVTATQAGFNVPVVINKNVAGSPQGVCIFIESADNARDNAGNLEPNVSDESALVTITWIP